jgi:alginate O-acetyltransferase complex protein AlgI
MPVLIGPRQNFWRQLNNLFLLLSSLVFYFWGEKFLVWIVVTSTFIDYVCGLIISGGIARRKTQNLSSENSRMFREKFGLAVSICSNLAFLGVFKYFNFGVESCNRLFEVMGLSGLMLKDTLRITLPLGISFYTFQSMSYTIDVYRGQVQATRKLIDFACYVTMFPQLVAGPIVRYRDIADQIVSRIITRELFASGVIRFILGLGKKLLIANTVSIAAEKILAMPTTELSSSIAWLGIVCYTIQIYFDFSGYSDMAIGLGRMLGFTFQENFNYPYISRSMSEFWQRWHISLSTWFRDYLYIPLGGNRRSIGRTYVNLMVVFTLCGLWHGASWTFVVWGLYHGFFLIMERSWLEKFLSHRHPLIGHAYTVLVILCGWVIFASDTLPHALGFLSAMFGLTSNASVAQDVDWFLTREIRIALIIGIICSLPVLPTLAELQDKTLGWLRGTPQTAMQITFCTFRVIGLCALFLICAMYLSAGTHNPFIYFRF